MGNLSYNDKLRMQTLHEQGLGGKAVISSYPDKGWKLSIVQKVCSQVDRTGSAVFRKQGQRLHAQFVVVSFRGGAGGGLLFETFCTLYVTQGTVSNRCRCS